MANTMVCMHVQRAGGSYRCMSHCPACSFYGVSRISGLCKSQDQLYKCARIRASGDAGSSVGVATVDAAPAHDAEAGGGADQPPRGRRLVQENYYDDYGQYIVSGPDIFVYYDYAASFPDYEDYA